MTKDDDTTVTLSKPVKIDGKDVTKITVREPSAGEMRGLSLTPVLQGSTTAMIKLLPRITAPPLSEAQVTALPMRDLSQLYGKVVGFISDEAETPPEAEIEATD